MGFEEGAGAYGWSRRRGCASRRPRDAFARGAASSAGIRSAVGSSRARGRAPLMRYEVTLDDRRVRVEVGENGRFTIGDRVVAADVRETVRGRQWSISLEGESHEITVVT